MRWTERQQRLLQAMGLQPWGPAVVVAGPVRPDDLAEPDSGIEAVPESHAADAGCALRSAGPAAPQPAAAAPVAPADADVAHMDWPALAQAVAQCQACALARSRTRSVFGVGHARAHWMIVGEAPGEQEDLRGEPFVGAAGQLLDRMLAALGLTREPAEPQRQVYIANTLKCRPPRNRNPEPAELQRCQPYLLRQVELVQPRIVLAMGRFAVQSLLDSQEPIGRLRGRVHRWRGLPLVVTYHPAYLLRNPADKARTWADLCLAAQALQPGDC